MNKISEKSSPSGIELEQLLNKSYWIFPTNAGNIMQFENKDEMLIALGPKQFNKDLIYLEMAKVWSNNSHCNRRKVGCLIVKNKAIIADGYNGTPTEFENVCEDCNNNTHPFVLHAEANAITKLAKSTQSSKNSTLYVTLSPCYECAKLIIQSGIRRVVFRELYRNTDSLNLLIKGKIELVRIS